LITPINRLIHEHPDITLVGVEDAAKVYFQKLIENEEIREKLQEGSLIIVPLLIDESNRRPLQIRDYSIFLN